MDDQQDLGARVRSALLPHRHIHDVALIGSRLAGTAVPLSDWDFKVEVNDFDAVVRDLPALAAPLEPLAEQWDRLSPHRCYMLMLAGPAKVDLLFLDQPHQPEPPWTASRQTLFGIDQHFWDWTLWLAAKQQAGKDALVQSELQKMSRHLLTPMGVREAPRSLEVAVVSYRAARDRLEAQLGVSVPRRLEREVLPVLN